MKGFLLHCFLMFSTLTLFSQNDCGTAIPIASLPFNSGTLTTCGTVNDYAAGSYCTSTSYGGGEDYVFTYTATATGSHPITLAGAAIWKIASVHTACPPTTSNCVGGITTSSGSTASGNVTLTAGTTYYIFVDTWPSPTCGEFILTLDAPPPAPANDECSGAIAFPTIPTDQTCANVTANTAGATQSSAGCLGTADDDVWYSFVCPTGFTSLLFSLTTVSGSTDRVIQFYSGSCGSLTSLLCSDPESGTVTGLVGGQTYYCRVFTYSSGVSTQVTVCLKTPPPPPKSWVGGTGNWGVDANWSPAGVPTCSDSVAITSGAVSLAGAAGECKGIAVAGGSLNIDAGSLTIGTCGMSGGGNRYFILSSGSVNLNGGDLTINGGFVASGGALNINSGNMNVDPNGSSGVLAVSSFSLTSTGFTMTGGNLNLLDGPSSGNIFNFSNSSANNLSGGNVVIGGGSATLNPNINTWVGSARIAFYNLVIQTGSSFVTSTYSFGILNDLTINSGELRGTTALYVAGNITNNGTLTLSTCNLYLGSFASGTAGATSKAQIIGGSGNYRNSTTETADFYSINVNNTNASGATFDIVDPTLSSTLTMTAGKIFGSASGNFVLWAKSTITYIAGWVVGNLKRTITASGATPFYVGTSGTYFPVTVNFTANPAGDLTAGFYSGAPGTSGLPLTESSGTNPYLSADSLWATGVWRITTSNIGSTTYSVSVTATGAPSNGNTANVRVVKRADNASDWTNPGTHVNGSGVVFSRSGLSGFSEFGIVRGSLPPLPLELLSFNAVPVGRKNRITWTSTNEQNTAIHIIERASKDDINKFIEIGKVTAAGTSTANLKYEFYDENPYLLGYYRLKTVDIDGSINYSEIVSCERTAERFAIKSIYPVPVENELTINYVSPESKAILVSIFDESGKEVVNFELQTVKGEGNESLNVKSLSSGIYFLRINEETFKFVKK